MRLPLKVVGELKKYLREVDNRIEELRLVGRLLGLTALCDSISVYIGPTPKEREKEERKDR